MCNCNTNNPCGCKPKCTGCPTFLDSSCVNNVDVDLPCSNILKGQTLSEVLVLLDAFICDKFGSISSFLAIVNVGGGAGVYKQTNVLGQKELKSLLGSNLITITSGTNEITLSINEAALNTFIEVNQKIYSVANVGTGVTTYKDTTIAGDSNQFNLKTLIAQNQGAGVPVLRDLQSNTNDNTLRLKTFTSGSILITSTATEINIEIPVDMNLKQFYVNEDYTGESTGTILKPFKTYVDALITVIGTGSIAVPQFINAQIVLQSNVTVDQASLTANAILENKISVNTLSVVSDSTIIKTILFTGTTNYPIDTEYLISKVGFDGSSKLNSPVYMSFSNIIINNSGSKGVVKHRNYYGGTLYTQENTSSLSFDACQIRSSYINGTYVVAKDSEGSNIKIFGVDMLVQDTIVNDTPHIYAYDMNYDGVGALSMSNSVLAGTNQTILKLDNTSFTPNSVAIEYSPYYGNTANRSVTNGIYAPKNDVYNMEVVNSYVRLTYFTDGGQRAYNNVDASYVGGSDALFKITRSGTPLSSYFEITEGYVFGQKVNYILKTTPATDKALLNCNFLNVVSVVQAFVMIAGGTSNIQVEGSSINDVVDIATSGITLLANAASINGFQFTSQPTYVNDAAAIAAGLIAGNIYYNTTIGAMKRI